MRVQGLHPGGRPRPRSRRQRVTSIVFDVELIYLARRRGYRDRDRPDPLVRQARLADARERRAWRCASRGTCCRSRSSTGGAVGAPPNARDRPRRAATGSARAALPIVADPRPSPCGLAVELAVAGDTLGFDFLAYHQAIVRLLDGQPLYDMSLHADRRVRALLLPADVRAAAPAVRACCRRRPRSASGSALSIAAFLVGVAILPVSRTVRWWIVLLAGLSFPFVYAIKLGQVGPVLFLLMAIGWRWLDDPIRLGASGALGAADQAPAGPRPRLGAADPALPGRRRRGGRAARPGGAATLLAGPDAWSRLPDPRPDGQRPDRHAAQLHARARSPTSSARRAGAAARSRSRARSRRRGRRRRRDPLGRPRPRTSPRSSPASWSRRSSGTITRSCSCCRSPTCSPPAVGGRSPSRS